MDVVEAILDCGGWTNSGNQVVSHEGFGEDAERRWMEARERANLGNEKMSKTTCSAAAGCGARRSGVKDPGTQRGQRKKKEQRETRRQRNGNMSKTPSSALQPLFFFFFKLRKAS